MIDVIHAWTSGLWLSWLIIGFLAGLSTYGLLAGFFAMYVEQRREREDAQYDAERSIRVRITAKNETGAAFEKLHDAVGDWMPGRVAVRPDVASFDTMAALREARANDRKRRKRLADRKRRQAAAQ